MLNLITDHAFWRNDKVPDVFSLFDRQGRKMVPLVVESFDEIRGVNTTQQLEEMERMYLRQ